MAETSFGNFAAYKQIEMHLSDDLSTLEKFCYLLDLSNTAQAVVETRKKLIENKFDVAIVGEFKRGKSTLINALIGQGVLPMDVLPATATINRVTYDPQKFAHIRFKNGTSEDIHIDRLEDYVTKLSAESEEMAKTVEEAIVHYPVPYCKNNVDIIDTPGLNDDECMTTVTMSVLPTVDAAIMVIMALSPFSESERQLLESKILANDLGRVLFAVTGIDLLDEDDVDKVLQSITRSITKHVMEKAKNTYGIDSEEYKAYQRKVGKVRVFGLSAKQALKAKVKHDEALLEKSCFPVFEAELERFLTQERGAVMLSAPISRILSTAMELAKAMEIRKHAFAMDYTVFEEKYQAALKIIQTIREEREQEFLLIDQNAQKTYEEMTPLMVSYWQDIEKAAMDAIAQADVTPENIGKKEAQAETSLRLTNLAQKEMGKTSQILSEQMQNVITRAVGKEVCRMESFEANFMQKTASIQASFMNNSTNSVDFAVATVASTFTLGLGGIYLGYKEAGWKGAVLGGASSVIGTMGGVVGFGALAGLLSIPMVGPALFVSCLGACAVGTFTGKWALGKAFAGKKVAAFKEEFSTV